MKKADSGYRPEHVLRCCGSGPWCDPAFNAVRESLTRIIDRYAAKHDVSAARVLADLVVLLSGGGHDAAAAARIALPLWLEGEGLPALGLQLLTMAEAQATISFGRVADCPDEDVDDIVWNAKEMLFEAWTEALEAAYASLIAAASSMIAVLSRGGSAEALICALLVHALIVFGERLIQPIADQAGERERQRRCVAEAALGKVRAEHCETS